MHSFLLNNHIIPQQPENIVLKDLETKQLKIIDFGTAQDLTKNRNIKAMVGTPEFIGMLTVLHLLFLAIKSNTMV